MALITAVMLIVCCLFWGAGGGEEGLAMTRGRRLLVDSAASTVSEWMIVKSWRLFSFSRPQLDKAIDQNFAK